MSSARSHAGKNKWRGSGFTLIEMLIVMGIIVLVVSAGLASYIKFNNKRKIEQAAMNFAIYLRTQQKRADAGEKPEACTGKLDSYRVISFDNNALATTDAVCGNVISLMPSFSLGNQALFFDSLNVSFKTLGKAPTVTEPATEVRDNYNDPNYRYLVSVSDGGVITVEEQ